MRDVTLIPEIAKHEGARLLRDAEADVLVEPTQLARVNAPIPYSEITWPARERPKPRMTPEGLREFRIGHITKGFERDGKDGERAVVWGANVPALCEHPNTESDRNYVHCDDCGLVFGPRPAPDGLAVTNSTVAETKNRNPDKSFDEDSGQDADSTHFNSVMGVDRELKQTRLNGYIR